jgi:hypothetical protein
MYSVSSMLHFYHMCRSLTLCRSLYSVILLPYASLTRFGECAEGIPVAATVEERCEIGDNTSTTYTSREDSERSNLKMKILYSTSESRADIDRHLSFGSLRFDDRFHN